MDILITTIAISTLLIVGGCLRIIYKRRSPCKPEAQKPSAPELIILDPSSLSFYNNPTLNSNYGEDIEVVGMGQKGATLKCYYEKERGHIWAADSDSRKLEYHLSWETMIQHFPKYAKEIKLAAMSPEERELVQDLE